MTTKPAVFDLGGVESPIDDIVDLTDVESRLEKLEESKPVDGTDLSEIIKQIESLSKRIEEVNEKSVLEDIDLKTTVLNLESKIKELEKKTATQPITDIDDFKSDLKKVKASSSKTMLVCLIGFVIAIAVGVFF